MSLTLHYWHSQKSSLLYEIVKLRRLFQISENSSYMFGNIFFLTSYLGWTNITQFYILHLINVFSHSVVSSNNNDLYLDRSLIYNEWMNDRLMQQYVGIMYLVTASVADFKISIIDHILLYCIVISYWFSFVAYIFNHCLVNF